MTDLVKINGIRLNKNYVQLAQTYRPGQNQSNLPLYQTLATNGINMVSMTQGAMDNNRFFISGTIALDNCNPTVCHNESWDYHRDVCSISIYPHHYRLWPLGLLFYLLGSKKISFQTLISSNAMLTFIVDQKDCNTVIGILSDNFDLPVSHVPFEQEKNIEQTQFLKRRYPETQATYMEKKIRTYGINLATGLNFSSYVFSFGQLAEYGRTIQLRQAKDDKFYYTSAYMQSPGQIHLSVLTEETTNIPAGQICTAEFLSFHGPHFGDRHSIISRALICLSKKSIPVLHTGCTGASIGIILPEGRGKEAKDSLQDVFENP